MSGRIFFRFLLYFLEKRSFRLFLPDLARLQCFPAQKYSKLLNKNYKLYRPDYGLSILLLEVSAFNKDDVYIRDGVIQM